jgi:hypothetical protein
MIPQPHLAALHDVCKLLADQPIDWAVTASCSLALQGVPVAIHDIDLQTDQTGAYAIEQLFATAVDRPVRFASAERIQSHFGALSLHGVTVEIMGAVQYRRADGGWDAPVDVLQHRRYVTLQDLQIPVLTLSYERQAYAHLGRAAKIELLETWLSRQS